MPLALITGASKGIGKAIAEELARKKYDLLLVARTAPLLDQLARNLSGAYGVRTRWLALDLTREDSAKKISDWTAHQPQPISMLVNNAGYGLSGTFRTYALKEQLDMMKVNMDVAVQLSYLLLPALLQQRQSYILNIASQAAFQAVPGLTVYAASKAFLRNFSRGLRYELRKTSVSVTVVCPGPTDTDFPDRARVGITARKAAQRLNMTPEAVANMAVKATLGKKAEVTVGFVNKLGKFFVWLLPKRLSEKAAAGIYNI